MTTDTDPSTTIVTAPTADPVCVHPTVLSGLEALSAGGTYFDRTVALHAGIVARAWGYPACANFIRGDTAAYHAGLVRGFAADPAARSWDDAAAIYPPILHDEGRARRTDVEGWWHVVLVHRLDRTSAELEDELATLKMLPPPGVPRAAEYEFLLRCALATRRRAEGMRYDVPGTLALLVALARATLIAAGMQIGGGTRREADDTDIVDMGCALTLVNYPREPLIIEVEPPASPTASDHLPDERRRWRIGSYAPGTSGGGLVPDPVVAVAELRDGALIPQALTPFEGQERLLARPLDGRQIGLLSEPIAQLLLLLNVWLPRIPLEYPPAAARIPIQVAQPGRIETRGILGPDGAWSDASAED
jgi:hypothetical protein